MDLEHRRTDRAARDDRRLRRRRRFFGELLLHEIDRERRRVIGAFATAELLAKAEPTLDAVFGEVGIVGEARDPARDRLPGRAEEREADRADLGAVEATALRSKQPRCVVAPVMVNAPER